MNRLTFAIAFVVTAVAMCLSPASARAAPGARVVDGPCAGCRASLPDGSDPVPLLVVLHGDYGQPTEKLLRAWDPYAAPRRIAVLALACPSDRGCKGSYWQWDGDPSWIDAQIDALEARRPIDRTRLWLAGWSGGASYVGLRTQELERTFAAIVHHGGGIPPRDDACGPAHPPIYFLVGSGNPLHHLAVRLRDHYAACKNEIVWNLLPKAEHASEWNALAINADAIFEWLATKHREPAALDPPADASAPAPSQAASPPPFPPPHAHPASEAPRSSCLCELDHRGSRGGGAGALIVAAIAVAYIRRRRSRAPRRSLPRWNNAFVRAGLPRQDAGA